MNEEEWIEFFTEPDTEVYGKKTLSNFDATSGEDAELTFVFSVIGRALVLAQAFEANLLCIVHLMRLATGTTNLPDADQDLSRRTLGQTLGRVKEFVGMDDCSSTLLDKGLAARNNLCHGFFTMQSEMMLTRDGRRETVLVLVEISRTIREAAQVSRGMLKALMESVGISEEDVIALKERLEQVSDSSSLSSKSL